MIFRGIAHEDEERTERSSIVVCLLQAHRLLQVRHIVGGSYPAPRRIGGCRCTPSPGSWRAFAKFGCLTRPVPTARVSTPSAVYCVTIDQRGRWVSAGVSIGVAAGWFDSKRGGMGWGPGNHVRVRGGGVPAFAAIHVFCQLARAVELTSVRRVVDELQLLLRGRISGSQPEWRIWLL